MTRLVLDHTRVIRVPFMELSLKLRELNSVLTLCCSSQRLRILYTKILASLQTMPQDAAYRKYTEQLVNERFSHVKTVSV